MRRIITMTVTRTERIGPHMVRVFAGGSGFDDFTPHGSTDAYVKLVFFKPGVAYPDTVDLDAIRACCAPEDHPVLRTYTIRSVDDDRREVAIDFVVHGAEGVAGPWADTVAAGEALRFIGPGGGYSPNPEADWHLLVGDESALPAIAAAVEALPDDATAQVFVEVAGPQGEVDFDTSARVDVHWVHRGTPPDRAPDHLVGDRAPLIAAVRGARWLPGQVQAFVHGEARTVMANLRPYLRTERAVDPRWLSISGYWRRGRTEEGFRAGKREHTTTER